ncbi:MAG: hypothetical protein LUC37_01175 [Prevotella sp.]|nr:hypothetical protein [Prevotella sp.]
MKEKVTYINTLEDISRVKFKIKNEALIKYQLKLKGIVKVYELCELREEELKKKIPVSDDDIKGIKDFLMLYGLRLGMSHKESLEYITNIFKEKK